MPKLRSVRAILLLVVLLSAGCLGSQRTAPGDEDAASGSPGQAEAGAASQGEVVGQTSEQSAAALATGSMRMPLGREVYLLESRQAPVPADGRSSAAFVRAVKRDSTTTTVEGVPGKVEALLGRMTLEEKVGQMTQLTLSTISEPARDDASGHSLSEEKLRDVLVAHHVGSILNVAGEALSLDHWAAVIRQLQQVATEETRLGIPVLYGIDAVHGANYTREAIIFPQNQGLAATWNLPLAQRTAAITARDVRASGISWNFAPVLDAGREPAWPRFYETFGEDVHLTTAMGLALLHGYQGSDVSAADKVAASLKHYIGYSGPESGDDRTPAQIPEIELREQYLPPFRAAVEAGAKSIMVNSGEVSGVPVHASAYLLEDVLREELGFEGVVVSDWLDIKKLVNVHHVAADDREATKMAVMAGVDMSMVPDDLSFYDHLLSLVRDGEVPEARVDEAVRRILTLKFESGLFDDPLRGVEQAGEVGREADRRVALQAARESITLLRNRGAAREDGAGPQGRGGLLPLSDDQRVLVTGPAAHSMQSLNNGWTYTWGGGGAARAMFPEGRPTIMEAIRARVGPERMTYVPGATLDSPDRMDEAVDAARAADVAVVALGEGSYAETPGNIDDLALPQAQRTLLRRVAATGTPVVLVLAQGRPRLLGDAADAPVAVLNAYNPGPEGGQAVMEVLYGAVNPSGHLPFTYPRAAVGHALYDRKHSENQDTGGGLSGFDPLFTFGSGGSYTQFAYSDLEVAAGAARTEALAAGQAVDVSVTVTNTGDRRGMDVAQLYVSDLVASVTPSVKKLKRFAKVQLAPGESTRLAFTLQAEDFSFVGRDGQPAVEPGAFRFAIEDLSETVAFSGERLTMTNASAPAPRAFSQ